LYPDSCIAVSEGRSPEAVTQLLVEWQQGDAKAIDRLMPLVYAELRAIAARYLGHESPGHTLQSTALVHEAYLRLIDQRRVQWQNRAHFFGIAAQMMRRILVDHARREHRDKRGGDAPRLSLDAAMAAAAPTPDVDVIALDTALTALAEIDTRAAQIVELRFFSGLTIEETAEVLAVSPGTIKRDWTSARAWLYRELSGTADP
jgi:RNA polymerase sigma factor (TIGR02999 family)